MTNSITIIGNITRDPELRFTPSGQANATFGVADNRRWQNRQTGEWEESTSFFNVVAWGELAENITESLGKGSRVVVSGRLQQRNYETQDGEKRNVVEVVADEVGPSLRWATVTVAKTDRRSGDGGGGAPMRSGGGGGGGGRGPSGGGGGGFNDDEEPF